MGNAKYSTEIYPDVSHSRGIVIMYDNVGNVQFLLVHTVIDKYEAILI